MTDAALLTYKLYILDKAGHIAGPPHIIEAATDETAVEMARRYLAKADLDLWQGARRVATLKPED